MSNNVLPFMRTLQKVYPHWIYGLTTNAWAKPWIGGVEKPNLVHNVKNNMFQITLNNEMIG
jgi:hypothetical protein